MVKMRKILAIFLVIIVVAGMFAGCNSASKESFQKLEQFEHATIGILSGSSFDPLSKERFPDAKRQYYSIVSEMILAVEQGKIDGYLSETTYLTAALWEGAKLQAVDEVIARTNAGYIFQKNSTNTAVMEQLNDFLRKAKESGQLEELQLYKRRRGCWLRGRGASALCQRIRLSAGVRNNDL